MTMITDEYMKEMIATTKPFTVVILKKTEKANAPEALPIVWEHGRRNFSLKADGSLAIVCPIRDESEVCGVGIFTTDAEKTKEIMDGDPGVQAGIFVYEIHQKRSFPGSSLPG